MKNKPLIALFLAAFVISGCSKESPPLVPQAKSQMVTYLGCDVKPQRQETKKGFTDVIDIGDKFILKGVTDRQEFFSGKLIITDGNFMISEPDGGLVFSKGINELSGFYLVTQIKENLITGIDCRNKLKKQ